MNSKLKIAIIGSGSTYTPELIESIIKRKDALPLSEIVLMDTDWPAPTCRRRRKT